MTTEHHLTVQRTARYYTLGDDNGSVTDVWIVCHGYGQLAAPFLASFARVASPSSLFVAPEALSRFYLDRTSMPTAAPPRVGAAWMTREDRDAEIRDHVAYLDALHDRVRPLDGDVRLRVLGFSQGVATVARWIAYGRIRPDELILWAGAFPPDVDLASLADRLAGVSVVFVSGKRDELAPWAGAEAQVERFAAAGIAARLVTFDGGHRIDDATLRELSGRA